jgi:hypothetical protein
MNPSYTIKPRSLTIGEKPNQKVNPNRTKYGCPYEPQLSSRTEDREIIEKMCTAAENCVGYYEDASKNGLYQATIKLPEDCKVDKNNKETGIKVGKFIKKVIKKENNINLIYYNK